MHIGSAFGASMHICFSDTDSLLNSTQPRYSEIPGYPKRAKTRLSSVIGHVSNICAAGSNTKKLRCCGSIYYVGLIPKNRAALSPVRSRAHRTPLWR